MSRFPKRLAANSLGCSGWLRSERRPNHWKPFRLGRSLLCDTSIAESSKLTVTSIAWRNDITARGPSATSPGEPGMSAFEGEAVVPLRSESAPDATLGRSPIHWRATATILQEVSPTRAFDQ